MKVGVIGAGSWGSVLGNILSQNRHEVTIYARSESQAQYINKYHKNNKYLKNIDICSSIIATSDIKLASKDMDAIVLASGTDSTRGVLSQIKNWIKEDAIIINVSKGVERDSCLLIHQIKDEIIKNNPYATLSGPTHAEEVAKEMPTAIVAASFDEKTARIVQKMFNRPYFRVYTSTNLLAVELGGAIKNVIAFGAGILDGCGYGENTKAALITRGIHEITKLGAALGAGKDTFFGLTGVGDLIVTCTSRLSRNWRAGYLLGQNKKIEMIEREIGMIVEGIYSSKALWQLAKKYNIDAPITKEIYKIVYENRKVSDVVSKLMFRDLKDEI